MYWRSLGCCCENERLNVLLSMAFVYYYGIGLKGEGGGFKICYIYEIDHFHGSIVGWC